MEGGRPARLWGRFWRKKGWGDDPREGPFSEATSAKRFNLQHIQLLNFHLQLGPKMAEQGFAKKFGALYYWGETRNRWSVLFDDRLEADLDTLDRETIHDGAYDFPWQVDQGEFDQILLEEAEERGAKVFQETEVVRPLLDGQKVVGVVARDKNKVEREISADMVVDASGQRCVLGKMFKLTRDIPDLQATATYCYLKGTPAVEGPLGQKTSTGGNRTGRLGVVDPDLG